MLSYLIFSLLASYGLAVLLVEFSDKWPIKANVLRLKKFVHDYIYWEAAGIFDCTVCMSFWTTFLIEICLYALYGYFLWPLSGFVTAGFTWTLIQFMNSIENRSE